MPYRSAEPLNGAGNSSNDQAMAGVPGVDGNITISPGDRISLIPRQLLDLYVARGNENNRHQAAPL